MEMSSPSKLTDKVVLVTGASRGIGLGCALVCLQHGAKVVMVDRYTSKSTEMALSANGFSAGRDALLSVADVRDSSAIQNAIEHAVAHFGRLDGVINNAGWHPPPTSIEETSVEDFEALVTLNLTSTFLVCKYAVPHLRKTRGAIVNMSSAVALIGQEAAPAYVVTKAGQLGLTRALALDLASNGIRVNAVCPSGVKTPLMEEWASAQPNPTEALSRVDSWHPLGRMATKEEIGEVCAFLLSTEAAFITGQVICADGGAMLGYRR
jgi:L-fucose dehydrogenase